MSWAQRLKRVFNIDIDVCSRCGGSVKVIACIEDQHIIDKILAHLRDREQDIPPRRCWHHRPEHHLRHCLFSQEADPQPHISKDASEKPVARTVAYSRSGIDGYELRDQLSQQRLRPIGGYFENFYSSVSRVSEEICFRQPVYFSYTEKFHLSVTAGGYLTSFHYQDRR